MKNGKVNFLVVSCTIEKVEFICMLPCKVPRFCYEDVFSMVAICKDDSGNVVSYPLVEYDGKEHLHYSPMEGMYVETSVPASFAKVTKKPAGSQKKKKVEENDEMDENEEENEEEEEKTMGEEVAKRRIVRKRPAASTEVAEAGTLG